MASRHMPRSGVISGEVNEELQTPLQRLGPQGADYIDASLAPLALVGKPDQLAGAFGLWQVIEQGQSFGADPSVHGVVVVTQMFRDSHRVSNSPRK